VSREGYLSLCPNRQDLGSGARQILAGPIGQSSCMFLAPANPHAQLMAEGGCRRAIRMRSADRHRVRCSFGECCREGPAHTPCADNGDLFHASSPWPRCVAPFPGSGNDDDLSDLAVAVQVVMGVPDTGQGQNLNRASEMLARGPHPAVTCSSRLLLLAGDRLGRALARARIGVRPRRCRRPR
jgi:hypothetical protein